MATSPIEAWHRLIEARDATALDDILADDVVFHSPVVHTPQKGKQLAKMYLGAAIMVLGNGECAYVRELSGESDAVLEFTSEVSGIHINGVDIIHWNADGKIDEFKVMIRPLQAVNLMKQEMAAMLEKMKG